jgi:hypothetical protein
MGVHKIVKQMETNNLNNWADCNLKKMVDYDTELKAL